MAQLAYAAAANATGPTVWKGAEYVKGECFEDGAPTRCEPVRMSFSFFQQATTSSTGSAPPAPFCVGSVSLAESSVTGVEGTSAMLTIRTTTTTFFT